MAKNPEKHEVLQPIHPSMIDRLDPTFAALYNKHIASTPLRPPDLAALRKNYSTLYSYGTGPAPDCAREYDDNVTLPSGDTISVRIYEPDSPAPWPVHIDYHGGGWGLGDLDTESHICKHICMKAKVAVIDVAYRLIPEHEFPTAIEDAFAVLEYIYTEGAKRFQIDPKRISLGGVSAGATISLACAHLARDAKIPLMLVAAGTPVIDDLSQYASAAESPYPSMTENEFAPTLNWTRLKYFDNLKRSTLSKDPAVLAKQRKRIGWYANLFNATNFDNLPRTLIFTAGADPLRDEGESYGRILVEHGNEVVFKRYPGVPHPFMHMDESLWQASDFIAFTAREVGFALHQ